MKNRYTEDSFRNKISIISVVCCMLVIWIHTNNMEVYGITNQGRTVMESVTYRFETIWMGIEGMAVPMFFFISGFLFYRNYDLSKIGEKYRSRFKSILIPYLIWASFYYLFFVVISWIPAIAEKMNAPAGQELSVIGWLRSLWPDQYYTLWFLKNLIVFIAISPLVYVLLKDRRVKDNKIYLPTGILAYVIIVVLLIVAGPSAVPLRDP